MCFIRMGDMGDLSHMKNEGKWGWVVLISVAWGGAPPAALAKREAQKFWLSHAQGPLIIQK